METLLWLLGQILWLVWSVLYWLIWQLLWLAFWVLLPVLVVAFIALRGAEYFLGPEKVRGWVKKHSMRFGAGAWVRTQRLLVTLSVMPVRVLGWLILYGAWHSVISLFWTPRWSPWQRAWSRRVRRRRM